MDTVAPGAGPDQDHQVAYPGCLTEDQPLQRHNTDTHGVNQWITLVTIFEINLAAHCRNPDTVTVTSDTGNHTVK